LYGETGARAQGNSQLQVGSITKTRTATPVTHQGRIVEHGPAEQVLIGPAHDYTRELLAGLANGLGAPAAWTPDGSALIVVAVRAPAAAARPPFSTEPTRRSST
jgi:hypothetical protein